MNKPQILVILALAGAALLPVATAHAQDADTGNPAQDLQDMARAHGLPVFSSDQVKVTLFTPQHASAAQLINSIHPIHGRQFILEENGARQTPPRNLQGVGDSILIFDTPEYTARVVATLQALDLESVAEPREPQEFMAEAELEMFEYSPQFISFDAALQALKPFDQKVQVQRSDWSVTRLPALTAAEELGHILVRETPNVIVNIRELLARVDVPAPHITLSCLVLQATREPGSDGLPAELVSNLSALVPYDQFEQLTMGLLTSSVKAGGKLSLRMPTGDNRTCSLHMRVGAFDGTGDTLTFDQINFSMYHGAAGNGPALADFTTAATITNGEYVVLGASGPQPIFAVLRMTSR